MADLISKDKRSWNMARIRSKNTRPEIMVRSILHRLGYRFSLRNKRLPGKPDIILPIRKTVIFVHGCFWHRHPGCSDTTTPKSREDFWRAKFATNIARDQKNMRLLRNLGWRTIIIWECEVSADVNEVATKLDNFLAGAKLKELNFPSRKQLLQIASSRADYVLLEHRMAQKKKYK